MQIDTGISQHGTETLCYGPALNQSLRLIAKDSF